LQFPAKRGAFYEAWIGPRWKHAGGHEIIRIPPQRRRAVSRALNSVDADQFAAKMASLRSAIVAFIAVQRIGAIVGIPILPGLHHHYVRM
jgi:hypothetical protein